MFDTPRYLSLDPWVGLITMISDRTYLNLEPTHCELISLENLGGLSTKVIFKTNRSRSTANILPPLPGTLEYTYNRLDPDVFFRADIDPLVIDGLRTPTTGWEVLSYITARTGVVFSPDDFKDIEIPTYGTYTLTAQEDSLRWVGQLTLTLSATASVPIDSVITVNKVEEDIFKLLSTGDDRTIDFVYAAQHDYTAFRYDIRALITSPNGLGIERLLFILREVTGDDWVFQPTPAPFNIYLPDGENPQGYSILYAGAPIRRFTPRKDKRSVVVLATDKTLCTALNGPLLIHYD